LKKKDSKSNTSAEEIGEYTIYIRIKGKRPNAHFLVKDIENSCDLAERYLGLEIGIKTILVNQSCKNFHISKR